MCQGKMKFSKNVGEMSGNFRFRPDEAKMFGPWYIFLAIHKISGSDIVMEIWIFVREMSRNFGQF